MSYVFDAPRVASLPVTGSSAALPRASHLLHRPQLRRPREGNGRDRRPLAAGVFLKPADAIVADGGDVAYPQATADLHHEVEMIVALAARRPRYRGRSRARARVRLRRRTRSDAPRPAGDRESQEPAVGFGEGVRSVRAGLGAAPRATTSRHPRAARLTLSVNGTLRQRADIADMIFTVPEIIHELSKLWELAPGDLIFTGTPAGVAALAARRSLSRRARRHRRARRRASFSDMPRASIGGAASPRPRLAHCNFLSSSRDAPHTRSLRVE